MAPGLPDSIDSLRSYLEWIGEKLAGEKCMFFDLIGELRLLRGTCRCTEMFFLQDFPSESEENKPRNQTLESFFDQISDAINGEVWKIYEEISNEELELDYTILDALFFRFLEAVENLKSLCKKALDNYIHSSQSKHCTVNELVDLIQLVSEDGKEIHRGSSLNTLQLHKLDLLKDFIRFAASLGVGQDKLQDLLAYAQVVVMTAVFCSYMLWRPQVMDGTTSSFIYSQYSEMLKVLPIVIVKVSTSCSSDYTSDDDDNLLEAFINSLQGYHLLEPLPSDSKFSAPVLQILIKDLRFLRNFFKDPMGADLDDEFVYLICDVVDKEGMLFNPLPSFRLKENTELALSNWMEKVQFLKQAKYLETSGYKCPRTVNELPDSTWKLLDLIDTLRSYLPYLKDLPEHTFNRYRFHPIDNKLRLLQRICTCQEIFSLQDLTSETDDQGLESSLDCLAAAINKKSWEIYSVVQEIRKMNTISERQVEICSSSFDQVIEILRSFLFKKDLNKYMHSAQSKHCTMEELLDLFQLVLEDGKKFHDRFESFQLPKLAFLKDLIRFAASRGVGQDILQDLLAHANVVVTTAAYYSYVLWDYHVLDSTGKSLICSQYLEMLNVLNVQEIYIRVLKALGSSCSSYYIKIDDNVVGAFIDSLLQNHWELLASKSSFTVSSMKILIEELRFLRNFLMYKGQDSGDLDEQMTNLTFDVVSEAGIVSYSLSWNNLQEVPNRDTQLGLSNWMEKVRLLKEDVAKKYPETSRYKFPRTNVLGFMDGLLDDLKELIRYKPDSIAFANGQLDVVQENLVFLRDFLRDMVKQQNENEELKALWFRVAYVAYMFEFVINSLVARDPDCSCTSFNSIKEEIKKIRAEVEEIHIGKRLQIEASNTSKISNLLPSRSSNPSIDEDVVGFDDEAEIVIDQLEANSAELDIVCIVGMPGQGKTTLAKKIYHKIRSRFLVCAWCCVSQGYKKRKLLLDILNDICGELPTRVNEMSDGDLEKDLYQSLKGRRYLMVLDDIWDIEAWRGLQSSFPNDHNQSRILITSRMHSVGLEVNPDSKPHSLRQLKDDESRDLLQKKLFHIKGFPVELQGLGMQIARTCKGLPLAIVTVAGILATLEEDHWEDFSKGLSTALVSGTEECTELFELSYTHLPDYLKPCLLYFGSFLQDQKVPVSRLIWLWMAEGFVLKTTDEKSLKNVAEDYLTDLIDRSLVMVVKKTSRGGIKTCCVHDLVHQFCVTKAKEENFLQLLNLQGKTDPLFEPRRLCFYSLEGVQCFRHLSSLKLFPNGHYNEVLSILCGFKILRVLDLRGVSCSLFPAEVEMLVHLRFLAIVGNFNVVPSTIVKLWNLETFLLRALRGEISLPYTLLSMTRLRHMHVNNRVVFSLPQQNIEKCCESSNLETFSTPLLSSGQDMVKILKKIPYLHKVKCTFFGSRDSELVYQFPALNFLSELESLKVHSISKVQYQLEFSFPMNLKKLTLSNFYLPWASISRFAELPNLEVLKLVNRACEGETWDMEEEVFEKLQYLKFENLDIVDWSACSDNFPCLQQLVLHKCRKLQGIPSSVGEIDSLEIVEVKHCHGSVATSAQVLEEEVEGLKVFIYASPTETM